VGAGSNGREPGRAGGGPCSGVAAAAAPSAHLIGPNAVSQTIAALDALHGRRCTEAVFARAALEPWLRNPPETMVDERAVATLHRSVREQVPFEEAQQIMADAGQRTGVYILGNRIPRLAHHLLPRLPVGLAGRVLLRAIRQHAWTFAGSGRFSVKAAPGQQRAWDLQLENNPLARTERHAQPICVWHQAVFQTLFDALLRGDIHVEETACLAAGDDCCRFRVTHRPTPLAQTAARPPGHGL